MKTNIKQKASPVFTAEGAPAKRISNIKQLRRSVMSALLWEREFYESGVSIADRVKSLVPLCYPKEVAELAIEAREDYHLRHMPLLLLRELARHPKLKDYPQCLSKTLARVCQRADEPAEFLNLYWSEGKSPISKQVKRGLAWALRKFNEYELAKYDRAGAVSLRDVLFLTRPKNRTEHQVALWKKLADKELQTPDTWEVALSAGADKKETWTRLIKEGKLGYLALLRNLRNMAQADVDEKVIRNAILVGKGAEKVLPFRYIAAARAAPQFENVLDIALQHRLESVSPLPGKTIILVDVSGSMNVQLSAKSDVNRMDAACAVAIIAREMADARVFAFSNDVQEVPARRGMALRDAITNSMPHSSTYLGQAIKTISAFPHDRLIVITDEQSADQVPDPETGVNGYVINVASAANGVGYGKWVHIDGMSEAVLNFIQEYERDLE